MSRGVVEKKGTERAVFVYTAKEKKNHYYRAVLVCTAKEKKTYSHTAAFVYAAKEKKNYSYRAVLVCTAKEKKTNRVPRRLGQPARHPAALRCDGPCRRDQHIYTALPRQGVWAPTTTIAMVRR